jgi:hypothetical protein
MPRQEANTSSWAMMTLTLRMRFSLTWNSSRCYQPFT